MGRLVAQGARAPPRECGCKQWLEQLLEKWLEQLEKGLEQLLEKPNPSLRQPCENTKMYAKGIVTTIKEKEIYSGKVCKVIRFF